MALRYEGAFLCGPDLRAARLLNAEHTSEMQRLEGAGAGYRSDYREGLDGLIG